MTPFITRLGFRAGALCSHQLWNQAMHCNASDFTWWPNFETFCNKWQNTYPKEIQIWFQEISQIWRRNTRASQLRFSGQREQTLWTSVLLLISSWRGWTCLCTPFTPSSGTWSPYHHCILKWPHSSTGWDSERGPCVLTSTFLQLSRPKRGFWARRKGTCWPPESEPAWQIHLHQIVCWPFPTHACYTFSESYHLHLQV